MLAIGIDCGSSFCKGALLKDRTIGALYARRTGWNMEESANLVVKALTEQVHGSKSAPVAATGYGRDKIYHTKALTEISAYAKGAEYLSPGVKTVIDIGGQDSKILAVENGKVIDFQMNDKCAAGSGRFLELIRTRLEVDPGLLEELLMQGERVALNSTCAVFAESEIIGLLARGVSRAAILGGAATAMAVRTAVLAGRIALQAPAVLCGGLAESIGICRILSEALNLPLSPQKHGAYAGAIGAALSL